MRKTLMLLTVLAVLCAPFSPDVRGWLPERVVQVEIPKRERSIEQLIAEVPPKYGVSPTLAAAIASKESNGRRDAIRFEPSQMARAGKVSRNPDQQRAYASSHGVFQVMGYHAPRFNLSWSDLYDPETNAEVAMSILKDCLDRHEGKKRYEQLRAALCCYNGSTKYADDVLAKVGRALIEQNL